MNILIVGEFSGFAKHLKNGLKKLGHRVTIVMAPDSFKKFKGDADDILYGNNVVIFGHTIKGTALLLTPLRSLMVRRILRNRYYNNTPDLIIVINSSFVTTSIFHTGTPLSFIEKQLKRGAKLILSECGSTPADCYNHQELWKMKGQTFVFEENKYSFLLDKSDIIIPTIYEYYDNLIRYAEYHPFDINKVHHAIPLPITIDKQAKINQCTNRKIVIFHGIIRPIAKGTPYIKEAMNRIQAEMPDRVECISRGGMPYDEYVKLFDKMDILIDQTYANGWGMNALIGAMNGKCVLTSCGPENSKNMHIPNIPFVRIGPDSEQIYQTLKELVLNPERIDSIKVASRKFAEDYCECSLIARRYLELVQK